VADQISKEAEAEAPHPQFATWMREFRLGQDNAPLLAQRWAGVTAVRKFAKYDEIEALVRLALTSRQQPSAPVLERIVSAFANEDSDFGAARNARELEVLAAITLVHLSQTLDDPFAPAAALALTTAIVGGARTPRLPLDLGKLGEHALHKLSVGRSKRPGVTEPPKSAKLTFEAAAAKVRTQVDAATLDDAFTLAGTAASNALNAVQAKNAAAISALAARLCQQDEELQMLWWVVGGRSEFLACAFDDVQSAIQPLVFAKELAEHTEVSPGPASLRAILSRAGVGDREQLVLSAAIGACETAWLPSLVQDKVASPVTSPIHYAIQRQIETGPGTEWVPGWAAATELPKELALTPLALAELFYRERLLLKAGK
jgi:hypothetical protein